MFHLSNGQPADLVVLDREAEIQRDRASGKITGKCGGENGFLVTFRNTSWINCVLIFFEAFVAPFRDSGQASYLLSFIMHNGIGGETGHYGVSVAVIFRLYQGGDYRGCFHVFKFLRSWI